MWFPKYKGDLHIVLLNNLCLHYVSIHRKLYQNLLIRECAREKRAKLTESQNLVVFVVRCIRTYLVKN